MLYPPTMGESVPITVRNTYLVAWALLIFVMPLLAFFVTLAPHHAAVIIAMGATLSLVALVQIRLIRAGSSKSAGPILALLGWGMLSWAAWMTGGVHSPALYGQFVLVVLAVMCNGWRWGMLSLSLSTVTVLALAQAEVAGAVPTSEIVVSPMLFAAIVSIHLVALIVLTALLTDRMRAMHSDLGSQLTERRRAERRLLDVIDNAPFGAFVCTLSDKQLLITHANRRAAFVLDTDVGALIGHSIESAFPGEPAQELLARLHSIAEHGGTHDAGALPYYAAGEHRTLDVHAFRIDSASVAVFFSDVTERRAAEAEINHMAFHDELTELPNRQMLERRLSSALAAAQLRKRHVALLFIDLDDFKLVNDRYGHSIGDQLLVAAAQRLSGCARATDTVVRLGGDEFTMIISDITNHAQAEKVARKAVEALHDPFMIDGHSIRVTASVGVSMTSDGDHSLTSLLEQSDAAMYQAKRAGRDGYRLHWSGAA